MEKRISNREADMALKERVVNRGELILWWLKCTMLYFEATQKHLWGTKKLWSALPDYFDRTRNKLTFCTNVVYAFLFNAEGIQDVDRETNTKWIMHMDKDGCMLFADFKRVFRFWCRQNGDEFPKMTEDTYEGAFNEFGLVVKDPSADERVVDRRSGDVYSSKYIQGIGWYSPEDVERARTATIGLDPEPDAEAPDETTADVHHKPPIITRMRELMDDMRDFMDDHPSSSVNMAKQFMNMLQHSAVGSDAVFMRTLSESLKDCDFEDDDDGTEPGVVVDVEREDEPDPHAHVADAAMPAASSASKRSRDDVDVTEAGMAFMDDAPIAPPPYPSKRQRVVVYAESDAASDAASDADSDDMSNFIVDDVDYGNDAALDELERGSTGSLFMHEADDYDE